MLESVVSAEGTGEKAQTASYTVAGKTGTSQKIDQKRKVYSRKELIASFAGFAPAKDPVITVLVIIDEPGKMMSGGAIAAPTFSRITEQTLNYLHIAPDKQQPCQSNPGFPYPSNATPSSPTYFAAWHLSVILSR